MNHLYNATIAIHYAAYRPPLHKRILTKALDNRRFRSGLDLGCGIGHSSLALASFCERVLAVDNSTEMLQHHLVHAHVDYQILKDWTSIPEGRFDIITLAGSLNYMKSQNLIDQIRRSLMSNGIVLIYDFEINMGPIIQLLGLNYSTTDDDPYDHNLDFSGLNLDGFEAQPSLSAQLRISPNTAQLAHLILSLSEVQNVLQHSKVDLYTFITNKLHENFPNQKYSFLCNVFYRCYTNIIKCHKLDRKT